MPCKYFPYSFGFILMNLISTRVGCSRALKWVVLQHPSTLIKTHLLSSMPTMVCLLV